MRSQAWSKKPVNTAEKVFVGMSGGVDSSVSAALLKKAGYDVTGVFIKVWQPDWIECNWKEERLEAMRAAAHLEIPFITLDLESEYKKEVIDYMIDEYRAGRTPNPDVMCNRYVKFGGFWDWAQKQGANYVATGHYARVEASSQKLGAGSQKQGTRSSYKLLAGFDENKDQSYFLWTLNQSDLAHILFPVGGMTKPEVRRLAKKLGLPNAEKKDSQGLCFIGKVDVKEFLAHYIKTEQGNVLDESGKVIGKHPGAIFFTIGERHGFTIDADKKSPEDKAYYVVSKDTAQNTITVSSKTGKEVLPNSKKSVCLTRINWVSGTFPGASSDKPLFARSRYRQLLQEVTGIKNGGDDVLIEFKHFQDTLTPGQSLVLYHGEECLGGGIIR